MNSSYEISFLSSLLFTVTVESIVIYLLICFFKDKEKYTKSDIIFAGVLPSATTLPYLWFVLPVFFIGNRFLYVLSGEILVTLVEVILLFKLLSISLKRALIYSVLANLSSYSLGSLIHF